MHIWNLAAVKWLLSEGLLPLLGAAALFLLWGLVRLLAADRHKPFHYSWKEALDPLGWLYGASILAIQSGARASSSGNESLSLGLYLCAGVCLLLLLAAMTNRGDDPEWKPRPSFQVVVVAFIVAILTAGYAAHFSPLDGGAKAALANGGTKID